MDTIVSIEKKQGKHLCSVMDSKHLLLQFGPYIRVPRKVGSRHWVLRASCPLKMNPWSMIQMIISHPLSIFTASCNGHGSLREREMLIPQSDCLARC